MDVIGWCKSKWKKIIDIVDYNSLLCVGGENINKESETLSIFDHEVNEIVVFEGEEDEEYWRPQRGDEHLW